MTRILSKRTWRLLALLVVCLGSSASRCSQSGGLPETDTGREALALTEKMLSFGPRPPGSDGITRVRTWLAGEISRRGFAAETDAFTASTPIGDISMKNISFRIAGTGGSKEVLLVAHYDSKRYIGFTFLGANDAASSVALLLALSREIGAKKYPFDVRVVLMDGEEALVNWTATDGLYGSRRCVAQLKNPPAVRAVLVVDMVGDADLRFIDNSLSSGELRDLLKAVVRDSGVPGLMETVPVEVEDDQIPFFEAGIPTAHLMDFSYPPWHTEADTLDKLSARSLSVAGEVILGFLDRLAAAGS